MALFAREHPPTEQQLALGLFAVQVALAVFFFGYVLTVEGLDTAAKKKIGVIIVFFFCAILFWGGFEQQATTFNTFAFDYTDRSLLGGLFPDGQHPATWYQSVNPAFIIILRRSSRGSGCRSARATSTRRRPTKMGMGLVLLGVGFLVMMLGRAARGVERRQGRADLAGARLSLPHLRRVVPLAGRACRTSPSSRPRNS